MDAQFIIIDRPKRPRGKKRKWCHITGKDVERLHAFALSIGLKREWFQDKPGKPHYDICSRDIWEKALKSGAMLVTTREMIVYMRVWHS